jgi:hypothetical protein
MMVRRSAFDRAGGYRPEAAAWEDLDFYLRVARFGPIIVIPDVLTTLRQAEVSERLRSNEARMEARFDQMYRCVEEYRRSGDYDALLGSDLGGRRLHPMTFVAVGGLRLWSGSRPAVLGRLWQKGRLGTDPASVAALAWAALGSASPRALRSALTLMMRARNIGAARKLAGRPFIEWRPPAPARPKAMP